MHVCMYHMRAVPEEARSGVASRLEQLHVPGPPHHFSSPTKGTRTQLITAVYHGCVVSASILDRRVNIFPFSIFYSLEASH